MFKVWNVNAKENIFVVKRGAKQQKGDGAWIYMILLTLKYVLHICWCLKTFRIMDVCIKTTRGGNGVFVDNNKRIINVAFITFRPYQWLKTKWWQMMTDWCFKIEITFEKSCHCCCCHHIAKVVTSQVKGYAIWLRGTNCSVSRPDMDTFHISKWLIN